MASKLRIAIALRDARGLSGTGTVACELAAGAARAGHEVRLLAHRPPPAPAAGVRPYRLGLLPFTSRLRAWSFDVAARLAARALGADVVHGHGDLTEQDVLTVNNVDAAEAHHTGRPWVGSPGTLYVRSRQFDPKRVRRIATVSERARKDLERFYGVDPASVDVIPLGVDSRRFTPDGRESARAQLRGKLGVPPETRIFLSLISGDAERRNVRGLIQAFGLAKLAPRDVLLIVGDPLASSYPESGELAAAGRLKLLPKTPLPELLYRGADAFLLAAHYETFGMTALEAMASGLPTAVTASCGVAELLKDGDTALVVPESRDIPTLAREIERLADPRFAAGLAERGLRAARERSWAKTVESYLALYARVHEEKARG